MSFFAELAGPLEAEVCPEDYGLPPDRIEPGSDAEKALEALREVIDPEVGINVVDLGLVYGLDVGDGRAVVCMTMTTPACPLGDLIQSQAAEAIEAVLPDHDVQVRLVWQPPWHMERMSLAARRMLGLGG